MSARSLLYNRKNQLARDGRTANHINKNGTYKFSHTDGTVSSGKVELGFYTIGGQVFQSIQNKLLNK